jgi:hypothetical protein
MYKARIPFGLQLAGHAEDEVYRQGSRLVNEVRRNLSKKACLPEPGRSVFPNLSP